MSTEMVTHTEKVVLRSADGKAMEVREHSWPEPADLHAKHASTDREALRSQERITTERSALRMQVAEFRGRVAELDERLGEARMEVAEVRAEAHLREKAIHAEHAAQIRREAEAAPQKYRPVGTVLPLPRPDELATAYLESLDSIERDLVELARQEGQAPSRTYWILKTPDAVPVEAAS